MLVKGSEEKKSNDCTLGVLVLATLEKKKTGGRKSRNFGCNIFKNPARNK